MTEGFFVFSSESDATGQKGRMMQFDCMFKP